MKSTIRFKEYAQQKGHLQIRIQWGKQPRHNARNTPPLIHLTHASGYETNRFYVARTQSPHSFRWSRGGVHAVQSDWDKSIAYPCPILPRRLRGWRYYRNARIHSLLRSNPLNRKYFFW